MKKTKQFIWVSLIDPVTTLDAATWVDTSREIENYGWSSTLIGFGDSDSVVRVRGVDAVTFSIPDIYFVRKLIYHLKIVRFILKRWWSTDVVMFHQISAMWLLPLKLLGIFGKRPLFIMDTRDLPDIVTGNTRTKIHLQFYWFAHWLANLFADKQIAITTKMAEMVKIPNQQLVGVWPSGVDVEKFSHLRSKRKWPRENDPIHLIYIGSLIQKRNPQALCEAVIQANGCENRFKLSMIGSGAEVPHLKEIAKKSNGAVEILPPVAHDDVPTLLAQAHVGVTSLPNADDVKYEASSPVKLFEYMAIGLPILATTNYCHTHVVGNGRYAFWVAEPTTQDIAKSLQQIWECRNELPALSQDAFADAPKWTWNRAAEKLANALDSATAL
ncbi:MAG: glycosyltransferase family 4 protein [Chloroflexota bacterium]